MKSNDIKNIIKADEEKIKKVFLEIKNPEPDRDWFLVIAFFVLIFIFVTVWSVSLYFLYFPSTPVAQQEISSTSGSVDEKKLTSLLQAYTDRKIKMSDLEKTPSKFLDVSSN